MLGFSIYLDENQFDLTLIQKQRESNQDVIIEQCVKNDDVVLAASAEN